MPIATRLCWFVIGVAVAAHAVVLNLWPDAHKLLIDLQVYTAGGEQVLHGRPLYDGGVLLDLPFVYPPFAALLFGPLSLLPLPTLKLLWTGLTLVLLGYVVRRFGAGPWPVPSAESPHRGSGARMASGGVAGLADRPGMGCGRRPARRHLHHRTHGADFRRGTLAVVACVAVATWLDPVRTTLYLGQINVLVMALVVGDLLGRPDSRWRGVGVGLAAALKLTPLLFVAYLLVTGRFRAAATALGTFAAAVAVGFALDPADSTTYWLRGTFAAAGRISDVAGTSNHSLNGLVARLLGDGVTPVYLAGAAVLVALTLVLARAAQQRGEEPAAVVLVGLCSAAVAPFSWSHHWVWVVPLAVLLLRRGTWWPLATVIAMTLAVITRLPGPAVGPIPSTGLISTFPDAYVLLFFVLLVAERARPRWTSSGASPAEQGISR